MKKGIVIGLAVFGLVVAATVAKAGVVGPPALDDGARGGRLVDDGTRGGQATDDDGVRGGR